MPAVQRCPECQKEMRVPDALLGKKLRCPNCKAVIAAPQPSEPEQFAELVEEDTAFTEEPPREKVRPRKPTSRDEYAGEEEDEGLDDTDRSKPGSVILAISAAGIL